MRGHCTGHICPSDPFAPGGSSLSAVWRAWHKPREEAERLGAAGLERGGRDSRAFPEVSGWPENGCPHLWMGALLGSMVSHHRAEAGRGSVFSSLSPWGPVQPWGWALQSRAVCWGGAWSRSSPHTPRDETSLASVHWEALSLSAGSPLSPQPWAECVSVGPICLVQYPEVSCQPALPPRAPQNSSPTLKTQTDNLHSRQPS